MKLRHGKGRLPPFVPVLKDTVKTAAWKALSHGARSFYIRCRKFVNCVNCLGLSFRSASRRTLNVN
jgi:hypothetical protein